MTNEQHIENLKKLKSFHNGSYGASVNAAINALEQQSCCEKCPYSTTDGCQYDDITETIPPFEQSKTGHWIAVENEEMKTVGYYCSECDLPMETEKRTDLCPNCGAKMSEIPTGAESEDKK